MIFRFYHRVSDGSILLVTKDSDLFKISERYSQMSLNLNIRVEIRSLQVPFGSYS